MPRLYTLLALPCLVLSSAVLSAQSGPRLGYEVGTTHYTRMAHDNSSPQVDLRMDRPLAFTVRFTSRIKKVGIGLSVTRSFVNFQSSDGGEIAIVFDDQAELWQYSPEVRFTALRSPTGSRLDLHAGMVLDRWKIEGLNDRSRVGAVAGSTLTAPVGRVWELGLRGDVTFTASPFEPNEAGGGISLDAMRRFRVAVGLSHKL
jgi:hypothetical protein